MPSKTQTKRKWSLASVALQDAFTDFYLSRQAMNCTPATLEFYKYTAGIFLQWLEEQGLTSPDALTARHVRQYLAELANAGKSDRTMHAHARAIRTLLRFWYAEKYLLEAVTFDMPRIGKKKLPRLTADELQQVLKACNTSTGHTSSTRDRALIMLMADSGLRRAEVCALNWGDVNISNGLVRVLQGKGRKFRSAAIGAKTRRALLAYRRTLENHSDRDPLFQTRTGERFKGTTLLNVFRRLSKRTGIHCTPHGMRRTYTILALRAGWDALHVQRQLGHNSLAMTEYYASLEDEDLLEAAKHSPIDNL